MSVSPWTEAYQAALSFTIFLSLLKFMTIEWLMMSNHLIIIFPLFLLQSFQASGSFLLSQLFTSGGQSIGASALASVLPMNILGWFPLGLSGIGEGEGCKWFLMNFHSESSKVFAVDHVGIPEAFRKCRPSPFYTPRQSSSSNFPISSTFFRSPPVGNSHRSWDTTKALKSSR